MRVNVVSFSSKGGAGLVASSLASGFLKIGMEAKLITATDSDLRVKPLRNPRLTTSAAIDQCLFRPPGRNTPVSLLRDSHSAISGQLEESDLTVFRWMNGILGKRFLKRHESLGRVVWGLDDMNPFTGVCHYSEECRGFESGCKKCPALISPLNEKASLNLQRKKSISERYSVRYTAPSDWMMSEFNQSELGKNKEVVKILNPLQSEFFDEGEESHGDSFRLRILIVASNLDDPTKGVLDVEPQLIQLLKEGNITLTIIGRASRALQSSLRAASFLGPLDTSDIIIQMARNDLLLVPSLYENVGMVIAEAASQKLPALVRNTGGMPEMVNFGRSGFLFENREDLPCVLDSISKSDLVKKGDFAHDWSQNLRPERVAQQFLDAFMD